MSITHIIRRGKHMYSDKVALSFVGRQTSYGDLYEEVSRCAGAFLKLDSAEGGSVGILCLNCDKAIVGFYGAMWAGKVAKLSSIPGGRRLNWVPPWTISPLLFCW